MAVQVLMSHQSVQEREDDREEISHISEWLRTRCENCEHVVKVAKLSEAVNTLWKVVSSCESCEHFVKVVKFLEVVNTLWKVVDTVLKL